MILPSSSLEEYEQMLPIQSSFRADFFIRADAFAVRAHGFKTGTARGEATPDSAAAREAFGGVLNARAAGFWS